MDSVIFVSHVIFFSYEILCFLIKPQDIRYTVCHSRLIEEEWVTIGCDEIYYPIVVLRITELSDQLINDEERYSN